MPGAFIGDGRPQKGKLGAKDEPGEKCPVMSAKERRDLDKKLASKLPGTPEQQRAFLDAAELEIDAYGKLLKPLHRNPETIPDDFSRLADAGRRFAETVKSIDPRVLERLGQLYRLNAPIEQETVREFGPVLRHAKDVTHANELLALMLQPWPIPIRVAAFWAETLGKTAEAYLKKFATGGATRAGPAPGGDAAIVGLVRYIANAYWEVFGERPAISREGFFAQALSHIFIACDFRDPADPGKILEIGESRMGKIMRGHDPSLPTKRATQDPQ
jgi:hypothetical protein